MHLLEQPYVVQEDINGEAPSFLKRFHYVIRRLIKKSLALFFYGANLIRIIHTHY